MKNMSSDEQPQDDKMNDDLLPDYEFNYSEARPNRFAEDRVAVLLDPDVAAVFNTSDAVNRVLRALIATMPKVVNSSN